MSVSTRRVMSREQIINALRKTGALNLENFCLAYFSKPIEQLDFLELATVPQYLLDFEELGFSERETRLN